MRKVRIPRGSNRHSRVYRRYNPDAPRNPLKGLVRTAYQPVIGFKQIRKVHCYRCGSNAFTNSGCGSKPKLTALYPDVRWPSGNRPVVIGTCEVVLAESKFRGDFHHFFARFNGLFHSSFCRYALVKLLQACTISGFSSMALSRALIASFGFRHLEIGKSQVGVPPSIPGFDLDGTVVDLNHHIQIAFFKIDIPQINIALKHFGRCWRWPH